MASSRCKLISSAHWLLHTALAKSVEVLPLWPFSKVTVVVAAATASMQPPPALYTCLVHRYSPKHHNQHTHSEPTHMFMPNSAPVHLHQLPRKHDTQASMGRFNRDDHYVERLAGPPSASIVGLQGRHTPIIGRGGARFWKPAPALVLVLVLVLVLGLGSWVGVQIQALHRTYRNDRTRSSTRHGTPIGGRLVLCMCVVCVVWGGHVKHASRHSRFASLTLRVTHAQCVVCVSLELQRLSMSCDRAPVLACHASRRARASPTWGVNRVSIQWHGLCAARVLCGRVICWPRCQGSPRLVRQFQ